MIEAAGGVRGGRPLQAVLLGGAAGSFVGPDQLDTPLTFEGVRAIGATLGSGVVLVLDDTADLTGAAAADRPVLPRRVLRPVRAVPGGHGTPGGTAGRLVRGAPLGSVDRELALLDDIAAVARDASICGLGQTAVTPPRRP